MATRSEHRRSTLLQLSAATTTAFEELGTAATIDDIAERAGVSRRTIFRYVDTKESLVFIHPVLWLEIFDEAVAQRADRPLRERVLHAAHAISEHIDADPEPVRRAMGVAQADPALMRGYAGVSQRWVERVAAEVLGDATDSDSRFRAKVLGAAVMGVIDAALADWYLTDPPPPLVDIIDRGLVLLSPIFEADTDADATASLR